MASKDRHPGIARSCPTRPEPPFEVDPKRVIEAYERFDARPLAGSWFLRDDDGVPSACPLGILLVAAGVLDVDGMNLVGHEVRDCRNYPEVASRILNLSIRDLDKFLIGFDGGRPTPEMRSDPVFRSGRENYSALELAARAGRIRPALVREATTKR